MTTFNMGQVPPVTFGAGRSLKLPDLVNNLSGGPVLLISDSLWADLGVTERLADRMSEILTLESLLLRHDQRKFGLARRAAARWRRIE